jgi:DNA anti-recombination protein RmuC
MIQAYPHGDIDDRRRRHYGGIVAHQGSDGPIDPALRKIFEELRDLKLEARADRRQADADRRQADADRRRSDERFEQAMRESRASFQQAMREFREDSLRRDVAMQKMVESQQQAFRDVRTVGLSIVKTLNRHTRLLERIDRKLGVRGNGRAGNGRSA